MTSFGLMLHHFEVEGQPNGQGAITADKFAAMLEFLGPSTFLSPEEWMEGALSGTLLPDHKCLTFDDALLCQYEIALPVLDSYGLRAFWFVYSSVFEGNIEELEIYRHFRTTRFSDMEEFYAKFFLTVESSPWAAEYSYGIGAFDPSSYLAQFSFYTINDRRFRFTRDRILGPERYRQTMELMIEQSGFDKVVEARRLWMNDDHLLALHKDGHSIGLHSYSHPTVMKNLSSGDQKTQYARNAEHLQKLLGTAVVSMSHPCGSYDERTLDILKSMGIRIGFRSDMAQREYTQLELPREDHAHVLKMMSVR